ncbi:BTB domain-containing protein [Mycena kentingensis (nom. inval.)]|nr:BTB domain-containing protein [Mycena kentingensis (nom. inval.)]
MADASSPPPKRKRTDSLAAEDAPTITRSDIWKLYGDVVLQAESTQFRVNRDVLATHSPVFEHMFSAPQPAGSPTVDGCPLVLLPEDTAKEWTWVLGVMYTPFRHQTTIPLDLIRALLKLGSKYEMSDLRAHAVEAIHYEFPAQRDRFYELYGDFPWSPRRIEARSSVEISLLNLIHKYGISSSLPVAGLVCLKMHPLASPSPDKVPALFDS